MSLIAKISIFFVISNILIACGDKADMSTPAQSSIDEYNSKLEECADKKAEQTTEKTSPSSKVPFSPFEPRKEDMVLGNANAQLILIEYFSPTCPHCAYFHKNTFPEIKKKYVDTGKIIYITREYIGNKQDLDAAILARCSENKEDFYKLMDIILSQQDSWAANSKYKEILTNIGQLGGISPEQYANCLNDDSLTAFLISNTQRIAKLPKFVGTPAFFINSEYFNKAYTLEALSAAIDDALNKKSEINSDGK